ncbi:hypothetical protein [Empedobacter brevis]|uniref:hypothetical protein n=1 Tax=Empedobacter brevis TaxID=247 RepID=UPI0028AB9812|nr:hypothetical protein [Empedobacter brevis]
MKKILLSALMAFIGSTSLFAQINTNAFDLSSNDGNFLLRKPSLGDTNWKIAFAPYKNNLIINPSNSFSDGVVIESNLSSKNLESNDKFIAFNTWLNLTYKNETIASHGMTRIGDYLNISGADGQRFFTEGSLRFLIHRNGNIGIGTENPDEKLTVKGKIHAEEIIVDLAVPADYVFQKYFTGKSELKADYEFPKLEEVEKFVKENNHLPGIPSAKEIQEKGLKVGEMNNLLLQKIEELTLLLIEQQKEINALKQVVNKN